MINVLIVDDRESKIEEIRRVLIERCFIPEDHIQSAKSVSAGIKALIDSHFHLLVLDIVLPQFDGDAPEENGGLSVLKGINDKQEVNLPIQIICLTEFPLVFKENEDEYNHLFVNSIIKREGDSGWIDSLAESVNHTAKLHNYYNNYYVKRSGYDVGIICALQEEFDQMMEAFGQDKWHSLQHDSFPYQFKTCVINTESMNSLHIIAACAGGAGTVPTATLSSILFSVFGVKQLYMTGFTGGFKSDDLELGDILISQSVQNYPVGKLVDTQDGDVSLKKEIQQILVNPQLINKVSDYISNPEVETKLNYRVNKQNLQVNDRDKYRIVLAPTVCVPFVLSSDLVQNELKKDNRKLLGIDMEGFALYYCAHQLGKQALWIKGVSDMADKAKDDKYHKTCAYESAFLLQQFLKAKF